LEAEGDKFTTRFSVTGTHQGLFAGIPAAGRSLRTLAGILLLLAILEREDGVG
jgi:predicted ester cyclase